jgi:hypothetical protein
MIRRFSLALASAAVMASIAVPIAHAAAPVKTTDVISDAFVLADCGGGVTLTETFDLRLMTTEFFDGSGNPTRIAYKYDVLGIITNSASGNTYRDVSHFSDTITLAEQPTFTGLVHHIIVPGAGPVLADVGKLTFDGHGNVIFEAGPHMVADGTAPDLCSVLV